MILDLLRLLFTNLAIRRAERRHLATEVYVRLHRINR